MVVDLELGSQARILELGELRVLHDDKGVFGEDVLDPPFEQIGPAEEARVVKPMTVAGWYTPLRNLTRATPE